MDILTPQNLSAVQNLSKGSDIASAATTDIGSATGNYVKVTGTATITALGTAQAGAERIVEFTGAATLTHNATSLILPGARNMKVSAGDVLIFVSLGSGNWKCTSVNYGLRAGFESVNSSGTVTLTTAWVWYDLSSIFNLEYQDLGGNLASGAFTAPRSGLYLFCGGYSFAATFTGNAYIAFAKNGTPLYGARFPGINAACYGGATLLLAAGDVIKLYGLHTAASSQTTAVNSGDNWFNGTYIGD